MLRIAIYFKRVRLLVRMIGIMRQTYSNIVCRTVLKLKPGYDKIHLPSLIRNIPGVVTNPNKMLPSRDHDGGYSIPSCMIKTSNPSMSCEIYQSGKITHCGGRSMERKISYVTRMVKALSFAIDEVVPDHDVEITIVNTMFNVQFGFCIDLKRLSEEISYAQHYPEVFTGCKISLGDGVGGCVSAVVFSTGNANIGGTKTLEEKFKYTRMVKDLVKNYKIQ